VSSRLAFAFAPLTAGPAKANLIYTSQPIFSAFFAASLLGEKLSAQGLVGGGVIVAAMVLSLTEDQAKPDGR
jgi:drug/metabolite transporter (DMT)-like permease